MARPKAVIFDCWNTLFYAERRPLVLRMLASRLLHHDLSYSLTKRFERSVMLKPEVNATATAKSLLRGFGLPLSSRLVARVERALQNSRHQPYPDTLETLHRLKKEGYKLGLITNSYQVSFEPLRDAYKLEDLFDVITTSYEAGELKPSQKIFTLTLKKLQVVASQAVMVGDNLRDDVQAANASGMTGVLLDRHGRHPNYSYRITELSELPGKLQELL